MLSASAVGAVGGVAVASGPAGPVFAAGTAIVVGGAALGGYVCEIGWAFESEESKLLEACRRKNMYWATAITRSPNVNLDYSDSNGDTPLHFACWGEVSHKLVQHLLQKGARGFNILNRRGLSPLHLAVSWGIVGRKPEGVQAAYTLVDTYDANLSISSGDNRLPADFGQGSDLATYLRSGPVRLRYACIQGDLKTVRALVEAGNINIDEGSHTHKMTALMEASRKGHKSVAEYLISKGANLGAKDNTGKTPVDFAKDSKLAAYLRSGPVRLMSASRRQDLATVEQLVRDGVDINAKDSEGMTALLYACEWGYQNPPKPQENSEVALYLIGRRAALDVFNDKGRSALAIACASTFSNKEPIVYRLLEKGTKVVNHADHNGDTPLHEAALRGRVAVVKALLQYEAESRKKNKKAQTPADLAESKGHSEIAGILRSAELVACCRAGDLSAVTRLFKAGVDINRTDSKGKTALMYACWHFDTNHPLKHLDVAKYLIDKGANLDVVVIADDDADADNGSTALEFACRGERPLENNTLVEHLLTKGTRVVNHANKKGFTPLHRAASSGRTAAVKALLEHKAIPDKKKHRWSDAC